MVFPYEQYERLPTPLTVYYPTGEEARVRWVWQTFEKAGHALARLFDRAIPELEVLLVSRDDWLQAPHEASEEISAAQPYWTDTTSPPTLVVPVAYDSIFGEITPEKQAFMLYQALVLAFLEDDSRPWPEDNPLWADEWQLKFAALWLSHRLDGQQGIINTDLREEYEDIFEPEPDGKTPVTIRGFDWYEDTADEDFLVFELLLEQFALDLLTRTDPGLLPRFLALYRKEKVLLSDDVTLMLAAALGPGGEEWLENLVYF